MTNKLDKYIAQKGNIYLYERAVPKTLWGIDGRGKKIKKSLGDNLFEARILRNRLAEADNSYWTALLAGITAENEREKYDAAEALRIAKGYPRPAQSHSNVDTFTATAEERQIVRAASNTASNEILGHKQGPFITTDDNEAEREEYRLNRAARTSPVTKTQQKAMRTIREAVLGPEHLPMNAREAAEYFFSDIRQEQHADKTANEKKRAKNTIDIAVKTYEQVLGKNTVFLDTTRQQALLIRQYFNTLTRRDDKPLSGGTANKRVIVLRTMWRELTEMQGGDISKNPFANIRWKDKYTPRSEYSVDHIKSRFLQAGPLLNMNQDYRHIFLMLVETGCRISEICKLEREDVILDHAVPHIMIRQGKTANSIRSIPLVGIALAVAKARPQGFGGKRFSDRAPSVASAISKFIRENDLEADGAKGSHSLRHSFETRLKSVLVGDDLRREILGHAIADGRPQYGSGYSLEVKRQHLEKIALPFDPLIVEGKS